MEIIREHFQEGDTIRCRICGAEHRYGEPTYVIGPDGFACKPSHLREVEPESYRRPLEELLD